MILLACAVAKELRFWRPREDVEALVTGVGVVDAACCVSEALARRSYELVVNAGIAGAFDGAARIGDGVVVIDESIELALEGGTAIALPDGETIAARAQSDASLAARLAAAGYASLHGITVSHVTATEATAARLARGGAQVETMEGFAVLRAAARAGVPAIEVRGISNRVGDRERSGWSFAAGIAGLERVLTSLFSIVDDRSNVPR